MFQVVDDFGDGLVRGRGQLTAGTARAETAVAADEPAEPVSDSETREEALREVERLMDERLSPLQRRVMEMREYEGLAVADIARRLDMQETAVRMNLSRARQALREMMKHSENR